MKKSVAAAVLDAEKTQVLAIKRRDVPLWVLPGGGVDPGETCEQAIIREVLEETGMEVEIKRQVAHYTPLNKLATETYLYECTVLKGTPRTGAETADISFYPFNALPSCFFHIHRMMLGDLLLDKEEVIKKPLVEVTYWKFFTYFLRYPMRVIRFACSQAGFPINSKIINHREKRANREENKNHF